MKSKFISLMIGLSIVGMQQEWATAGRSPVEGLSSTPPVRQQTSVVSDESESESESESAAGARPGTPVCIRTDSTVFTPKNLSPCPAMVNVTPECTKRPQQSEVESTTPITLNRIVEISAGQNATPMTSYDYTQVINFQLGDLIYGLQDQRNGTMQTIRASKEALFENRVMTIDQLNNPLLYSSAEPAVEIVETIVTRFHVGDRSMIQDYVGFMMKRFASHEMHQFLAQLREGDERLVIAKLCTDAISWMHQEHRRIHFILDGLNFATVVHEDGNERGHRSYTSQELRTVYELWKKGENILETVLFYQGGKQLAVRAPWLDQHGDDIWEKMKSSGSSQASRASCASPVERDGPLCPLNLFRSLGFAVLDKDGLDKDGDEEEARSRMVPVPFSWFDEDEFSASVNALNLNK